MEKKSDFKNSDFCPTFRSKNPEEKRKPISEQQVLLKLFLTELNIRQSNNSGESNY